MSRLADSASLYLRQHADDPVEWRAWGDSAFEEASRLDRPVLLSVGFSACHWCHVMQRESFRDPGIAATLNGRFVPVKVDREQRPDVDAVYMDYVTASTGGGGWPMNVFLTPDRLPLLGGTYFPARPAGGRPSFADVLAEVDSAYHRDRDRLARTEAAALAFLREMAEPRRPGEITPDLVERGAHALLLASDPRNGGLGTAPKFPHYSVWVFLAAFHRHRADGEVAHVLGAALDAIVRGGIFDQAGGGVSRYAVDEAWAVPHFEKMLFDNAMLLRALAAAEAVAPSAERAMAASLTFGWLEREMRLPSGAYASALAAEAGGIEGGAYTWTREELEAALDADALELAVGHLGASGPPHLGGAYVLSRRAGRASAAGEVDAILARLLAARATRPQPERDGKAVVSWNALAARGLIEAGTAFADDDMVRRGLELVGLLAAKVSDGIPHVLDDPEVSGSRLAEDHAHLVAALLTAHERGADGMLERASDLHAATIDAFVEDGVVWMTEAATDFPVRPREQQDEPLPSGASTVAENCLRLARATGDPSHRELAERLLARQWAIADHAPQLAATALTAMADLVWG